LPPSLRHGIPDDLVTAEQLLASGWTARDLRQLPTPHGSASSPYGPLADIAAWIEEETR
jgi:hypothetical protein